MVAAGISAIIVVSDLLLTHLNFQVLHAFMQVTIIATARRNDFLSKVKTAE